MHTTLTLLQRRAVAWPAGRRQGASSATRTGAVGAELLSLQALAGNRATAALLAAWRERDRCGPDTGEASRRAAASLAGHPPELTVQRGRHKGREGGAKKAKSRATKKPAKREQKAGDGTDSSWIDPLLEELKKSPIYDTPENEVHVGLDLWLSGRVGNVHDVDVTKKRIQAAGELSGGVGGGAYGRGAVATRRDELPLGLTLKQYKALAELGAFMGAEGKAAGQLRQKLGPAYGRLVANAQVFAGVVTRARASGGVTFVDGLPFPVGLAAEGAASASAGVRTSGQSELTLGFSPDTLAGAAFGVAGDFAGFAGAEASAKGGVQVDLLHAQLSASGEASAFAGASIEGSVGTSGKLYGRTALKLKGKAAAAVGVGGKVAGGFSLSGGRLELKLFGLGAWEGGLGLGGDLEADFKPLAVFVWRQASQVRWQATANTSEQEMRTKVENYNDALNTDVRPRLERYRDSKLAQLRMNQATNYVKLEKVQAILDWHWPRTAMKQYAGDKVPSIDAAITSMLTTVFEDIHDPSLPVSIEVQVSKGVIESFQTNPRELHVLLGGGIEGRHAFGSGEKTTKYAKKSNLLSDVGK